jgi:hypothetical protein
MIVDLSVVVLVDHGLRGILSTKVAEQLSGISIPTHSSYSFNVSGDATSP